MSWEIVDDQIIEDERGSVAIVWAPEYVRLIAAAPELLEALEELCRAPHMTQAIWDQANAAIAKATGGK